MVSNLLVLLFHHFIKVILILKQTIDAFISSAAEPLGGKNRKQLVKAKVWWEMCSKLKKTQNWSSFTKAGFAVFPNQWWRNTVQAKLICNDSQMPAKNETLKNFVAQKKHSDYYKSPSPICWLKEKKKRNKKTLWTARE